MRESHSGNGVGEVFSAESLEPLTGNCITFFHRHAGVFAKHLGSAPTPPREESEEVILADRPGTRRRIHSRLTTINKTTLSAHLCLPLIPQSMPEIDLKMQCAHRASEGGCIGTVAEGKGRLVLGISNGTVCSVVLRREFPLAILSSSQVPYPVILSRLGPCARAYSWRCRSYRWSEPSWCSSRMV